MDEVQADRLMVWLVLQGRVTSSRATVYHSLLTRRIRKRWILGVMPMDVASGE